MAVNIHISGDNAGEALKELSAFAAGMIGGAAVVPSLASGGEAAATVETPTGTKRGKKPQEDKKSDPEPVKQEIPPEAEKGGELPDNGGDDDGAPIPTVVELRAKASEVGTDAAKKAKIRKLLDEFESKSISDVPEEKRVAFMERLEGLAE